MKNNTILTGDCLEIMKTLPDNTFDAVVTDPPYGLKFMNKEWDHGIPGKHFWEEVLRVAKPGSHLLAFGGTRTYHRLACAVEDAGWEIRDCINWVYGSGFPKSHQVLKPAYEPIIMARKPFKGTVANNVQKFGTGAINIDLCRVGIREKVQITGAKITSNSYGKIDIPGGKILPEGRWPANIIHDGSDEVLEVFPETKSGAISPNHKCKGVEHIGTFKIRDCSGMYDIPASSGSASRFFYCAKASPAERGKMNSHPTVKPLSLMKYLCRLVTPPGGTVLDPFAGSGSTLIAAREEGFNYLGIELNPEYVEIANARLSKECSSNLTDFIPLSDPIEV